MSYIEEAFMTWLGQNPDIPTPEREHRFAPPRMWRFDMAWPQHMVAVEIEGLSYSGLSNHQMRSGFMKDAEKYEEALLRGWTVYRVPGPWIAEGGKKRTRWIWRERVLVVLRELLVRADPDGELGQGRML